MKLNKPNFLIFLSHVYLVFLLVYIWIYDPELLDIKNCLLFIPLYVPILISTHIRHKGDKYANDEIWDTRNSLLFATALVVIFKIAANHFR